MGASLEHYVRKFFMWYGLKIYDWRWQLFIVPIIISALLSVGFYKIDSLKLEDPAYVFTPRDARWRQERETLKKLWPLNENKFLPGKTFETKRFVSLLVKAKNGGNVLQPEVLDETELLNQWILNNITIETSNHKFLLTYQDLCLSYNWVCGGNEHILMLKERRRVGQYIDLKFPRGGTTDTPVYLGTALGGVTLNKTDNTVLTAQLLQLSYFLKQETDIIEHYSSQFEYAVEKFLLHTFESDIISYSFAHQNSLKDGLQENAKHFTPNFVFSFAVLTIYAIVFSFTFRGKWRIDTLRSKPYVACAGLITTLLALVSSFGTLLLLGVHYNVINTIIPFLLIAIGIDDMFIMNACWDQTDRSLSARQRMSEMLAHAGVAVSITNITDILSFAIGCITELPGIELFCTYACFAVLYCYVYQLTFFAGFQAIMGKAECDGRHCLSLRKIRPKISDEKKVYGFYEATNLKSNENKCIKTLMQCCLRAESCDKAPRELAEKIEHTAFKKTENELKTPQITTIHTIVIGADMANCKTLDEDEFICIPSIPLKQQIDAKKMPEKKPPKLSYIRHFFGRIYGPFLLKTEMRALTGLFYLLFIVFAVAGCVNYREGLNPENLVTNNHYIGNFFRDLKKFWIKGPQVHVTVLNPPNFTDPIQREKLMAVVRAFENTDHTLGREGTVFFFLEYLNYLNQVNAELENTDRLWNTKLRSWLKYTGGSTQWAADIKFSESDNSIEAFRFQVAAKNVVTPNDHKQMALLLRGIADKQPFNVQVFHETFPFADQYIMIVPATIRNIIISLICMSVVALLLVPSLLSCVVIVISIISISVGMFGYMTFWGVNLDAISMISIIMSIGFAVDLSAHISYAFVTSTGESKERVRMALETLGWPIFQGATSTITGISILYSVNAYIILTFFKTIWLTMVIGMLHGLVFIPVALSFLPISLFHISKEAELSH